MMTQTDARNLALALMNEHGLIAKGWTFKFNTNKRRLGVCKFGKTMRNRFTGVVVVIDPVQRIEISVYHLADDVSAIRDTILHEIAHALAGPAAKHGPEWKRVARSIGCTAQRCGTFSQPAEAPYIGHCLSCDKGVATMYRRPRSGHTHRGCGGRIEWRHNGTGEPVLIVRRPPTLRSLSKHFPANIFGGY